MSFSYQPMTEQECEEARGFTLLQPGIYDFHVKNASAKLSKSGNDMIELILNVKDTDGTIYSIFDYLVATKGMAWKIRHFCRSAGLESEYELGNFNEHLAKFKKGKVKISLKKGKEKPEGGFYPDKNTVEDYIGETSPEISKKPADPFGDDVPF